MYILIFLTVGYYYIIVKNPVKTYCYTVDEAWLAFRYAERASYLALTQYCALD